MGFSEKWVQLVFQCVTMVYYSIVHGEHDMRLFFPSRGLHQEDPLSPYLFIICAEGLSALIRKYEKKQWINGVKICRQTPVISHILFADDRYFYCKVGSSETRRVLNLLAE